MRRARAPLAQPQPPLALVLLVLSLGCCCCGPWRAAAATTPQAAAVADPLARTPLLRVTSSRSLPYVRQELLLRQVTQECARRADTVLQLGPDGGLQVLPSLPDDAPCPALDIALRGAERGVGMCTDAALYLVHMGATGPEGAGARILPLLPAGAMAAYGARCARVTARMFLESMYHEWLAPPGSGGYHLMQVNSEHMFKVHHKHHAAMDVFLCKTQVCQTLVWQYVTQHRMRAEVWYIGHTSSDVLVEDEDEGSSSGGSRGAGNGKGASSGSGSSTGPAFVGADDGGAGGGGQEQQGQQQQPDGAAAAAAASPVHAEYDRFLHVKGKSGLKHTRQLLECWTAHPEFPMLTVVGQASLDDPVTQAVLRGAVKNVQLLPRPAQDAGKTAAVDGMARRLAQAAARSGSGKAAAAAAAAKAAPAPAAAGTAAKAPAAASASSAGTPPAPRAAAPGPASAPAAKAAAAAPTSAAGNKQPAQQQPAAQAASLQSLQTPEFEAARAKVHDILGLMGQQDASTLEAAAAAAVAAVGAGAAGAGAAEQPSNSGTSAAAGAGASSAAGTAGAGAVATSAALEQPHRAASAQQPAGGTSSSGGSQAPQPALMPAAATQAANQAPAGAAADAAAAAAPVPLLFDDDYNPLPKPQATPVPAQQQQQQQPEAGTAPAVAVTHQPHHHHQQQPAQQAPASQQQPLPQQRQGEQQPEPQPHGAPAAAVDPLHTPEFEEAAAKVHDILAFIGQDGPLHAGGTADTAAAAGQQQEQQEPQQQQWRRRLLSAAPPPPATSGSGGSGWDARASAEARKLASGHLMWTPPLLQKDQLLSFGDIRRLQAASGVHICASEREGFGHYINEARAAGSLILSTDHPPMNELVQDGVTGVLVKPSRTGSYNDWQALGAYQPLNAFLEPSDLCAAVQRVLKMPLEERQRLGHAARQQYLLERSVFAHKVKVLRRVLSRRRLRLKHGQQ